MSLFNFGKNKVSNVATGTSSNVGNDIGSTTTRDTGKVTLEKATKGLDRHIVSLKREKGVDLSKHRARAMMNCMKSSSSSTFLGWECWDLNKVL